MGFLFIFPVFAKRIKKHSCELFWFCITSLTAAVGISIIASDFAITNRYLTDYLYLAVLPAVFVMFCFYEKLDTSGAAKVIQSEILICSIIGVCLFAVLSLTGEEDWLQKINPLYYDKLRYWTSPWL